jgi:hypothetical protein
MGFVTISGTLLKMDGTPAAEQPVEISYETQLLDGKVIPKSTLHYTSDENGLLTIKAIQGLKIQIKVGGLQKGATLPYKDTVDLAVLMADLRVC